MGSFMDITRRIFTKAIVRLIPYQKTPNLSAFIKGHIYFFYLQFIVNLIKRTWYSPIKYKSNLDSQYEIVHSNTVIQAS